MTPKLVDMVEFKKRNRRLRKNAKAVWKRNGIIRNKLMMNNKSVYMGERGKMVVERQSVCI